MVKSTAIYRGEKHCEVIHEPSKSVVETDAPKDNAGRGEKFSPTDLVGAALGTCILTTMAIVAERDGHSLVGASAEVVKEMNPNPRRIAKLGVRVTLPKGIAKDYRAKLEQIAHTCPVSRSLHPDVALPTEFIYPD